MALKIERQYGPNDMIEGQLKTARHVVEHVLFRASPREPLGGFVTGHQSTRFSSAKETWREVDSTGYFVSSLGRVRGRRGRILSSWVGSSAGHLRVTIEGRHEYVHRLVALAFIGPENGEVCHNDNDPMNNAVDNLRWDTRSANVLDLREIRTHCPHGHEFTPENTRIEPSTGWRRCRECKRAARAA